MTKTCYVLTGIPASGKSTIRAKMLEQNSDAFVYSTDDYVEEIAKQRGMSYSSVWESTIEPATDQMDEWLSQATFDGLDVIWDQTNLSVGKRKKIIDGMHRAGYRVEAHAIRLPEPGWIDAWKELAFRLKSRPGKEIPFEVITRMTDNYVLPTLDEGFDDVVFYSIYGGLVNQWDFRFHDE